MFLVGQTGSCCFLSWHANKVNIAVTSTTAAEALSLQEAIDDGSPEPTGSH